MKGTSSGELRNKTARNTDKERVCGGEGREAWVGAQDTDFFICF